MRRGRGLKRAVRAAVRLPAADKLETLRSLLLALVVECAVRVTPLPALARRCGLALDVTSPEPAAAAVPPTPPFTRDEARRVRAAMRVMAIWPFGQGTCLRQSLVLGRVLRHRNPVLRIGVRVREGVVGHAWIEVAGTTIGGDGSFLPLVHGSPGQAGMRATTNPSPAPDQ
jgi:hypothetical protein